MHQERPRLRIAGRITLVASFGVAVVLSLVLFAASVVTEPKGGPPAIVRGWPAPPPAQFPQCRADSNHRTWADTYSSFGKSVVLAMVIEESTTTGYECWSERVGWPFEAFALDRFRTSVDKSVAGSKRPSFAITPMDGGALRSGIVAPGFLQTKTPFGTSKIPVRPIWGGLLANIVALWVAVLTTSVVARFGFRAARLRRGVCPTCGYELRGLITGSPCPECGSPPTVWPR